VGKNKFINSINEPLNCMYKMSASNSNSLTKDLIITGGHSILVDNLGDYENDNKKYFGYIPMVDDKFLLLACVSNDFKKLENNNVYTYYHIVLESENDDKNFGIYANGILTESISKTVFLKYNFIVLK